MIKWEVSLVDISFFYKKLLKSLTSPTLQRLNINTSEVPPI